LLPIFTPEEWNTFALGVWIASITTLTLSAFMIVSFVLNPDRRAFPIRLVLYHEICIFSFAVAMAIDGYKNYKSIWCIDDVTVATHKKPACGFQAVIVTFFGLAAGFWFAAVCFHFWLQIRNWHKNYESWRLEAVYHGICWGLPFLAVIINLAADNFL